MPPDPRPGSRIRNPQAVSRFRLEHVGEPCERCELRPGVHVHHRTFRSQGGDDIPENMQWLCHICHDAAHGIRSYL
jgi:hypothetical protein